MRVVCIARGLVGIIVVLGICGAAGAGVPKFKPQEIDKSLKIGYGVVLSDINGDSKPDIVVADKDRVIWFENPSWQLRTILGPGKTKPDHVCLDAADIDGDGKVEIALGAGWMSVTNPATLQWLKRGESLDQEWTVHPIAYDHPSLHRIRFADLDGNNKAELIVSPLHGKGVTQQKNFSEAGPRFGYLKIPADPTSPNWEFKAIDDGSKRVMHNFLAIDFFDKKTAGVLTASYEGVFYHTRSGQDRWVGAQLGEGYQADPTKSRGSSEVKVGKAGTGKFIATIEPFHGSQTVVYSPPIDPKTNLMKRTVLDERIKSGHALWCADLDGDGTDEIVMGFRDPFSGMINYGINVYHMAEGGKWEKTNLDNGGVAVEDLVCGDLNGDGRVDIVAVGRGTKNVRVYWNEGK